MKFSEILRLFHQGKATAKSHMKDLIEMAARDGNFDTTEYNLLKEIGRKNGISESHLTKIRQNPEAIPLELPKDRKEKFRHMYDLVHMMTVDKSIHPEEARLCQLFAVRFGYDRQKVNELIDTIRNNIENGQGYEEAMTRLERMRLI
jgi:uncharacterized tellurite resistance protein B-like protein